jgi:hypothetical protein
MKGTARRWTPGWRTASKARSRGAGTSWQRSGKYPPVEPGASLGSQNLRIRHPQGICHTYPASQTYATDGVGTAWERACERAGVENATLGDILAKARADTRRLGYRMEQIMIGAAHTDADTASGYTLSVVKRQYPKSGWTFPNGLTAIEY